nr:U-box domain-containing protein 14-like [Tanacetum cinerariifolium]
MLHASRALHIQFHFLLARPFEKTASKFHVVTSHIEETLSQIHYESFELSEEVHEQKDLVRVSCGELDTKTATRLSKNLCLTTVNDLKRESLAIHDLVISTYGYTEDHFAIMSYLLKQIKDGVMLGNLEVDISEGEKSVIRHRSPVIPHDFQCPVFLELMKDHVIVSTVQ